VYRYWYGNGGFICKGINGIDEDLKTKALLQILEGLSVVVLLLFDPGFSGQNDLATCKPTDYLSFFR